MKQLLFSLIVLALALSLLGYIFLRVKQTTPARYMINTSSQSVIKELRALNRLETSSFTIEKVIDAGTTSNNQLKDFLLGDRILLIAHGEAIAGFDLSQLTDRDVQIEGETIRMNLPSPKILVVKLDSDQTRVYDRRQGLLTKGDKNLESEARKAAESSIRDAACQGNILSEASTNARKQLTALLKTLGFVTVIIAIPEVSC